MIESTIEAKIDAKIEAKNDGQRALAVVPDGAAWLDGFDTPLAHAQLDGTIEIANAMFRSWVASTAGDLAGALGVEMSTVLAVLRAGKPHVITASAKNARGRKIPVEYVLRLVVSGGRELIAIEGRDVSRVHEKEAMLQSYSKTIETNNRRLVAQKSQISELLDDVKVAYAAAQRLLDSTDQGFATLTRSGTVMAARSAVFDRWFGTPAVGTSFADCLRHLDPDTAVNFEVAWWQIEDDILPLALLIEQLPAQMRAHDRYFRIGYKPELDDAGRLASLLVVVSDITAEVERNRAEAQQHDIRRLLAAFAKDRDGIIEFVTECDGLIATITANSVDPQVVMRAIHTLKGNCGIFGARAMATSCHELETRIAELGATPDVHERRAFGDRWRELRERLSVFLELDRDRVSMTRAELEVLCRRVAATPSGELPRVLETWMWEPGHRRLARLGEQVRASAARFGKGPLAIEIDGAGLRFEPERWNPLWASMVHLVRNSVDHGLETAEVRGALGKPASAQIRLRTYRDGDDVVIELGDDGRGIDWDAVARKANQRGLDTSSHEALVRALFLDGFSTRDAVDEQAGRGVGLAAVRAACEQLAGSIKVTSEPGQGTLFRLRLPAIGVAAYEL